jgi:hypothetical protein
MLDANVQLHIRTQGDVLPTPDQDFGSLGTPSKLGPENDRVSDGVMPADSPLFHPPGT